MYAFGGLEGIRIKGGPLSISKSFTASFFFRFSKNQRKVEMSSKIALALLVAMVVTVAYAEHQAAHGHGHEGWGWSHPKYKYSYGVTDKHTHDNKHASEWRDGDTVKGHYALQEPDGHWRTVHYWADKGGFHAKVDRSHGGWKA